LTYQKQLVEYGYRVLLYDMPGQGQSSKPVLYIPLGNQTDLLENLLEALNIKACHVAGISFGGVVGLLAAIRFPDRIKSLVAMSTFSEMPSQLVMLGAALHSAITQAGFPLVQALLLPMNLSSAYVEKIMPSLNEMVRRGYAANDPYAIQNLMESFVNFKPFTEELKKIKCPTLILNGEFDYLTPRLTHDIIRRNIPNSRLLVFPKAFHAFTLENPTLTIRILEAFVRETLEKKWKGDQSVWIASEDPTSEVLALRFIGDHLRAVFMPTGPGRQQTVTIDEWKAPLPGSPRRAARARKPAARPPQAPKASKAPKRGGKPPAPTPPKPSPKGSKAKQPS
jgi:pimeloyl-ACP methyl ester carboxylesterase